MKDEDTAIQAELLSRNQQRLGDALNEASRRITELTDERDRLQAKIEAIRIILSL